MIEEGSIFFKKKWFWGWAQGLGLVIGLVLDFEFWCLGVAMNQVWVWYHIRNGYGD